MLKGSHKCEICKKQVTWSQCHSTDGSEVKGKGYFCGQHCKCKYPSHFVWDDEKKWHDPKEDANKSSVVETYTNPLGKFDISNFSEGFIIQNIFEIFETSIKMDKPKYKFRFAITAIPTKAIADNGTCNALFFFDGKSIVPRFSVLKTEFCLENVKNHPPGILRLKSFQQMFCNTLLKDDNGNSKSGFYILMSSLLGSALFEEAFLNKNNINNKVLVTFYYPVGNFHQLEQEFVDELSRNKITSYGQSFNVE